MKRSIPIFSPHHLCVALVVMVLGIGSTRAIAQVTLGISFGTSVDSTGAASATIP
jgi:hypothetical protein